MIGFLLLFVLPASASAATIRVGGGCTLANAIYAANLDRAFGGCPTGRGLDEIRLPDGVVIPLVRVDHAALDGSGPTGLPAIRSPIVIRPEGANVTSTIARIDAAPPFRIFQVEAGGSLTLQRIVVSNGRLTGATADDRGGCLEARSGSLLVRVDESTFERCAASLEGAAIASRAAELRMDHSTVADARVTSGGGGSALWVGGMAVVTNCTISGNDGRALVQVGGLGTLRHCTLDGASGMPTTVEATLSATVQLRNTILRGATATSAGGSVVTEGVNVIDPAAVLEPIADNGGLSPTRLPMNGGPAIDTADPAFCAIQDQRRVRRPQGAGCDVGSVEREAPVVLTCGDGMVDPFEECDDGGETADCDADCTVAECGDRTVNVTAGEECDDGVASPTCNADCTRAICGDGVVSAAAGEECDDGSETISCDSDCTIVECGDRHINAAAGEECDDGNSAPHDGCSRRCRVEGDAGPRRDGGSIRRDAGPIGSADAGTAMDTGSCAARPARRGRGWVLGLLAALAVLRRRRRSS